jgi:cell volume regulation protein A
MVDFALLFIIVSAEKFRMAGEEATIGALGVLTLVGVASRLFLRKTGFSDVFLLMLFGVAAGWLIPPAAVALLSTLALPFAAITLLMIILDEGLNLSFEHLKRSMHKALLFGTVSFFSAFLLSFLLSYFVVRADFFLSLIIASMFGGVAPELLSGFLSSLSPSKEVAALGDMEAVFSEALSLMLTLIFAAAAISGQKSLQPLPFDIAFSVLLSVAMGGIFAAFWRAVLSKSEHENQHLLVIGLAAILYALSGFAGANSVIAVFTFAFFLGNISHPSIGEMRRFQSEISFFLRTFFFVYLGILLFNSPAPLWVALFALALSLLFAASRMLSGKLAAFLEPSARAGRLLESVSARGLTPAVLSVVVFQELATGGVPSSIDLPLLALFVIFFTNAISAFLVIRHGGARKKEEKGRPVGIGELVRGGLDALG